jgi:hypothetical protein
MIGVLVYGLSRSSKKTCLRIISQAEEREEHLERLGSGKERRKDMNATKEVAVLLVLCAGLMTLQTSSAGPISVAATSGAVKDSTSGVVAPTIGHLDNLPLKATGTVGVHVVAGAITDPPRAGYGVLATTNIPVAIGRTRPKLVGNTTQSDFVFNGATATMPIVATTTTSSGFASWRSNVTLANGRITSIGAKHTANAGVTKTGGPFLPAPNGFAIAESEDPLQFNFTTSGALNYTVSLGSTSASEPFEIQSDSSLGSNNLTITAGFTNVTDLAGDELNGQLYSLSLSSSGVVSSPNDVSIDFTPWSGLGLTSTDVKSVEDYVRSNLSLLSDGAIGFSPGLEVPLFGSGGPLSAVTLDYAPGEVTYQDTIFTSSALASPEPSSIALLSSAVVTVAGYCWLRRRRTPDLDTILRRPLGL